MTKEILFPALLLVLLSTMGLLAASPNPYREWAWLRAGAYASYTVLLEQGVNRYRPPERIEVLFPVNDSDLVMLAEDKYGARRLTTAICGGLAYSWRIIGVNSTYARVRLRLTMLNVTVVEMLFDVSPTGMQRVRSNTTRYSRLEIVREVYVRLDSGVFTYRGFRGQWIYWLDRERLSNSTILMLSNLTVPSIYPEPHIYVALRIRGPASLHGYNETIEVSNQTLGPERLAIATGDADILAVMRMIGLEVPANASRKDALRILYKYRDSARIGDFLGRLWYDMGTGVMLRADMDPAPFIGYSDDVLYRVMGIAGFFPVEPPLQRHPWVLALNDTNVDFSIVVMGGGRGGTPRILLLAVLLVAALILAAAWRRRAAS